MDKKQFNVLLDEDICQRLEREAAIETIQNGRKVTPTELIRNYLTKNLDSKSMNRYYEIHANNTVNADDNPKYKQIKLLLGDKEIIRNIGKCEILFVEDELDYSMKIHLNISVRSKQPIEFDETYRELFRAKFSNDLLKKDTFYDHKMYLTKSKTLPVKELVSCNDVYETKTFTDNLFKCTGLISSAISSQFNFICQFKI